MEATEIPPIDIVSTTEGIVDDDVAREISACLDDYMQKRNTGEATVRLLAVIAGSVQRCADYLKDIATAIDDK